MFLALYAPKRQFEAIVALEVLREGALSDRVVGEALSTYSSLSPELDLDQSWPGSEVSRRDELRARAEELFGKDAVSPIDNARAILSDAARRHHLKTIDGVKRQLAETLSVVAEADPAPAGNETPAIDHVELEAALSELHRLIGLDEVKAQIERLANRAYFKKWRKERGLRNKQSHLNMVFFGNPGTGKTSVARILGRIYAALGILERGHLVEVSRSDLVGNHIGDTALKTRRYLEQALGGVLLVDEAYALSRDLSDGKDFGQEAIDEIVKFTGDRAGELVVIVTGYPDKMAAFHRANRGIPRRFPIEISFPDYDDAQLLDVLRLFAKEEDYLLAPGAETAARALFERLPRDETFSNAGDVENLFELWKDNAAARVRAKYGDRAPPEKALRALEEEDITPLPKRLERVGRRRAPGRATVPRDSLSNA